jgi:hypothetical protein
MVRIAILGLTTTIKVANLQRRIGVGLKLLKALPFPHLTPTYMIEEKHKIKYKVGHNLIQHWTLAFETL